MTEYAVALVTVGELPSELRAVWMEIAHDARCQSGGRLGTIPVGKIVMKAEDKLGTVGFFNETAYFRDEEEAKKVATALRQDERFLNIGILGPQNVVEV